MEKLGDRELGEEWDGWLYLGHVKCSEKSGSCQVASEIGHLKHRILRVKARKKMEKGQEKKEETIL